ncbi:transposase domain-containing protein [Kitasatospora sp. NPDC088783]|uniref:transposase domain-containing protein n=1 Tax=Kitasatospora sp. NPDC088783 TaxID=3364077 RepID=UPI0037F3B438
MIAECGRTEKRHRLLPARVVVYFVLAMRLFCGQGYEELARLLTQGPGAGEWPGGLAGTDDGRDRPGPAPAGTGAGAGRVRRGLWCGREDRSPVPASPSVR